MEERHTVPDGWEEIISYVTHRDKKPRRCREEEDTVKSLANSSFTRHE